MKQKFSVMLLIRRRFFYYFNEIRVFRAVFVICSWLFRDLFVICSWFFRNLFAICSQFVIYSRIVRNLFANCLQIICSPLFTNKANKTRISRSLFAFFKNHECSFVFYFGLFVDTLDILHKRSLSKSYDLVLVMYRKLWSAATDVCF